MNRTNLYQRNKTVSPSRFAAAWLILLGVGLASVTSGCTGASRDQELGEYRSQIEELAARRERPAPLAEAQSRGGVVYSHYCQICHGAAGQGDGFNSSNLAISPRDFSDEEFWKSADAVRLATVISAGGKSVGKSILMPAWGQTLSQDQIRDVVAYLRTIPASVQQAEAAAAAEEAAEAEETE